MRIILYSGKGGVGKTSIAAATALRCAELGHRTLAMSTDAAHSLSDSFDIPIGADPSRLADNLWGQETNLNATLDKQWATIQRWLSALLAWRGLQKVVADEIAILPGMEELANLLYIVHYSQSGNYDTIIIDCAPTGETLRLLSFPEILSWWVDKLFPIQREAVRIVRPVLRPLLGIPVPDDEVLNSIETFFPELRQMRAVLTDSDMTSMRLVVNAEKMVIKETQRTFTYLNLYGYFTDLIICNRFIPETVTDHYFDYWKTNQEHYYHTIQERFAPLLVRTVPLMEREVVGFNMLSAVGHKLFGDDDPTKFFYRGKPHRIEKEGNDYTLSFDMPNVSKEQISLTRSDDELIISVGNFRRNIILPRALVNLAVRGAKLENNRLVVRFAGGDERVEKQTHDINRR